MSYGGDRAGRRVSLDLRRPGVVLRFSTAISHTAGRSRRRSPPPSCLATRTYSAGFNLSQTLSCARVEQLARNVEHPRSTSRLDKSLQILHVAATEMRRRSGGSCGGRLCFGRATPTCGAEPAADAKQRKMLAESGCRVAHGSTRVLRTGFSPVTQPRRFRVREAIEARWTEAAVRRSSWGDREPDRQIRNARGKLR
jgi:hypothetical protein